MTLQEISVYLDVNSNSFDEVVQAMAIANINIRAISVEQCNEHWIIRIIPDNSSNAYTECLERGFAVEVHHVMAVRLNDSPGGLARALDLMKTEGIQIEHLYSAIEREQGDAIMIIYPSDASQALEFFKRHKFQLVQHL